MNKFEILSEQFINLVDNTQYLSMFAPECDFDGETNLGSKYRQVIIALFDLEVDPHYRRYYGRLILKNLVLEAVDRYKLAKWANSFDFATILKYQDAFADKLYDHVLYRFEIEGMDMWRNSA